MASEERKKLQVPAVLTVLWPDNPGAAWLTVWTRI
jgi:hypothetical protein